MDALHKKKQHLLEPLTLGEVPEESKDLFEHVINIRNLGLRRYLYQKTT